MNELDTILEIEEYRNDLIDCVRNDRCFQLFKDDKVIGFFTYHKLGNEIFLNNLYIMKAYRNKGNLLFLREVLRGYFPSGEFSWLNHRRNEKKFEAI